MNITLGLEPISWLLLAVVALMAGIPFWLTQALALYLDTIEAKSKNEEGRDGN